MRHLPSTPTRNALGASTVALLLVVLVGVTSAAGQPTSTPWHLVQASDGTLYVLKDGSRFALEADPITDDDLQAFPDGGPLGPLVLPAVTVEPTLAPTPVETPSDGAVSEFSVTATPFSTPSAYLIGVTQPTVTPSVASAPVAPAGLRAGAAPSGRLSAGSPPSAPVVVSTPVPAAEAPVVLAGTGSVLTRSFSLHGGSYTIIWTAATVSSSPDNFAAFLRPADPSVGHSQVITTVLVPGGRSMSGQAQALNVPAGTYYVEVIGGSNWNLSVSAQPGAA